MKLIKSRYVKNADGRKEKDGFICSSATWKWFDCVAVKIDKKSSFLDAVQVRDTKDLNDTTLKFSLTEWDAFVTGVKNCEFDI